MEDRPKVLVGKIVSVRAGAEPPYYTDAHRGKVGDSGVVHAIVPAVPRDNPLVKVKFGDDRIVFFRLSELDVRRDEPAAAPERHGTRASHLP